MVIWVDFANLKIKTMNNKQVEITIKELILDGDTAIKIMKCLKEYEPKIWEGLKNTLKQKLPI